MIYIIAFLVAIAVACAVFLRIRPFTAAFVITLRDGKAIVTQGEPPADFVTDVQRIAEFSNLKTGIILGIRGPNSSIKLQFRGIAKANQWQFRNAWRNPI